MSTAPPDAAPDRAADRRADGACFLLLILALAMFAVSGVINNDELDMLSDAQRMASGAVPYRDFFEFVPPVSLWFMTPFVAVFGASMRTSHAVASLVVGAIALQSAWLSRRLGARHLAWLPAFLVVFSLYAQWAAWSYHWLANALALGAMVAAFRGFEHGKPASWLLPGVLAGLTGMTVQVDGLAVAAGLGGGLLLDGWRGRRLRLAGARLGWLALGMVIPVLLTVLVLAAQGALHPALYDVLVWPLTQYRHAGGQNDLAFGTDLAANLLPVTALPGWYVRVYHVLFTYALFPVAGVGTLAWLASRPSPWTPDRARVGSIALWACLAFALASRGRLDLVHVAMYAVPALWLACYAAPRLVAAPGLRWLPVGLLVAELAAGAMLVVGHLAKVPETWRHPLDPDGYVRQSAVIRYLKEHARPGDRLAAMPYGGFYYLYALPPASAWTLMYPPVVGYGAPEEFDAFWAELARARPRFIVIAPWAWTDLPTAEKQYADRLPPGYRRVGAFDSPQYAGVFPAFVYERPGQ